MVANNNMESKQITKAKERVDKLRVKLINKLSYKDYLFFSRYNKACIDLSYLENMKLITRCFKR